MIILGDVVLATAELKPSGAPAELIQVGGGGGGKKEKKEKKEKAPKAPKAEKVRDRGDG